MLQRLPDLVLQLLRDRRLERARNRVPSVLVDLVIACRHELFRSGVVVRERKLEGPEHGRHEIRDLVPP